MLSLNITGNTCTSCSITLKRVSVFFLHKSNKYLTFWMCVCSLSYLGCKENARYHILVCGLSACTTFFTLSHKRHDFRKKVIECKMCLILTITVFERFLISRRFQRDTIISMCRPSCKLPGILQGFNETWFSKTKQVSNFMKICPQVAEFFLCGRTARQTDRQTWRS